MSDSMHAYYSARAPHMAPRLDEPPTGQLLEIVDALKTRAQGRTVLEVACGTAYWTRFVAPSSAHTVAADFSTAMLAFARRQQIPNAHFVHDDAYQLAHTGPALFDFGYAMHWVSHIPLSRWREFFATFHARLKPGATVLLADDIRRPDDSDPYYSKLSDRDSYEIRRLPGGGSYEIIKTYFSPADLQRLLAAYAENLQIHFERPRWWVTYTVKAA